MPAHRDKKPAKRDQPAELAREAWLLMSDLVLDHQRRRDVTEVTGLSFSRARAVRRVARRPMSMGELAEALGIDRPNATVVVDDLEAQELVRRRPHPTDRRTRLVEATRKGKALARRADEVLGTPPDGLRELGADDLATLRTILFKTTGSDHPHTTEGPEHA
jgi:DNA-binding MarR family transcriptional regulator